MIKHKDLTTNRLHLRKLIFSDAPVIFKMMSDQKTIDYANLKKNDSIKDAEDFILKNHNLNESGQAVTWAINLKDEHKMVGHIGLYYIDHFHAFASFGSILLKKYWNRGIISEAHKAVINFIFTSTNLNRLESQFFEKHIAVEKMLIKSGLKKEALLRQNFNIKGKFENSILYSIIKDDFLKNPDFFTDNQ